MYIGVILPPTIPESQTNLDNGEYLPIGDEPIRRDSEYELSKVKKMNGGFFNERKFLDPGYLNLRVRSKIL
ncbi:MAG: hypothetical protein QW727_02220 [Candidatus Pacearchaeota archaeon]